MPGAENRTGDRQSIEMTVVTAECDPQAGIQLAEVYKISHKIPDFLHSLGALLKQFAV